MKKVRLEEAALYQILDACLKGYKREAFGYLTGYRKNNIWIVKNAFFGCIGNYFETNGTRKETGKLEERLRTANLQIIGDFHSDNEFGEKRGMAEPSTEKDGGEDLDRMLGNPDWIYIILAINSQKRK